MASIACPPIRLAIVTSQTKVCTFLGSSVVRRPLYRFSSPNFQLKYHPLQCTKFPQWEPSPAFASADDDGGGDFLKERGNIFESTNAEETTEAHLVENIDDRRDKPMLQAQPLKWTMWLLGPSILLTTGMAPTLWLPLSSVFLGANIASFLSLVGLDCIFNVGATLFLLMADACSRPKSLTQTCNSRAPLSYRIWNLVAGTVGFIIPLMMLFASHKGLLQPQISPISFGILLGPYFLLLSIQMLTEMLTWRWQSPVWLMTPVVYEAYRVLQLMRGLRLSADIVAPMWIVETIRVLVSWWVLILGMQLMRVAWFAGFTARTQQQT